MDILGLMTKGVEYFFVATGFILSVAVLFFITGIIAKAASFVHIVITRSDEEEVGTEEET